MSKVNVFNRSVNFRNNIFAESDFKDLCKYMNWNTLTFEEAKEKIEAIDIEVKVFLKENQGL